MEALLGDLTGRAVPTQESVWRSGADILKLGLAVGNHRFFRAKTSVFAFAQFAAFQQEPGSFQ